MAFRCEFAKAPCGWWGRQVVNGESKQNMLVDWSRFAVANARLGVPAEPLRIPIPDAIVSSLRMGLSVSATLPTPWKLQCASTGNYFLTVLFHRDIPWPGQCSTAHPLS